MVAIDCCTGCYCDWCPFGRHRVRSNGRRRPGLALFCFRASAYGSSYRCDADDCSRYFGSFVHAGCRWTRLYGEAGRKVIAQTSGMGYAAEPFGYLSVYFRGRNRAHSLFGASCDSRSGTRDKIRPERPLGIAVIASQQAITASPISAATVALLGMLAGFDISLFDILKISVPATLIGVLVGAFCSMKVGKELVNDPEYQRRLKEGMIESRLAETTVSFDLQKARISVGIFLLATFLIVLFGSVDALRPVFWADGKLIPLDMPSIIEIIMLSTSALILIICRIDGIKAVQGSIFRQVCRL